MALRSAFGQCVQVQQREGVEQCTHLAGHAHVRATALLEKEGVPVEASEDLGGFGSSKTYNLYSTIGNMVFKSQRIVTLQPIQNDQCASKRALCRQAIVLLICRQGVPPLGESL